MNMISPMITMKVNKERGERRQARIDLALEFGASLEHRAAALFWDENALPGPKKEIGKGLLYLLANASTAEMADAFAAVLFILADYQEGVGDEPLNIFPNGTEAIDTSSGAIAAWASSTPFERIGHFGELARKERELLNDAIADARASNVLLVPWHVKLWHRLTGKGQFHRSYRGFVDLQFQSDLPPK